MHYNKILLSGILISIFTLIIILHNQVEVKGSSEPGQSAFLQKRAGFSLYNNTDYGFQILYPQDWTFVEGDAKPGDYTTDIVTFEPLGEKGKHYSSKAFCGQVCLTIHTVTDPLLGDSTLQQFSDADYNSLKKSTGKSFKLLEYKTEKQAKLGDKKAFEISFQGKRGNNEIIQKVIGVLYPDPDASESKTLMSVIFATRDKYSNEMLPLANTMIDSFRFIGNNTK